MAVTGRVIGAITSGLSALARDISVERSAAVSGYAIISTISKPGFIAFTAASKPPEAFLPKRSLEYITTIRLGLTPASLKISVMYRVALRPKVVSPGKLR